jgi:glycosyltransferase involved in cell wall biosynthesis
VRLVLCCIFALCCCRAAQRRAARWSPHAGLAFPTLSWTSTALFLTHTQWPPIKGLYRDAECVAWALQSLPLALRPAKATISDLSVFVVPSLYDADNHTLLVHYLEREWTHKPGNPDPIAHISQPRELSALTSALAPRAAVAHSVLAWCANAAAHRTIPCSCLRVSRCATLHVIIVFETALPHIADMCVRLAAQPGAAGPGQRHILFVNPDWFLENEWFMSFLRVPGVELVAKSIHARSSLEALLMRSQLPRPPPLHYIQFSIPNPVIRARLPPSLAVASRPMTFAMFAGNGGHKNRRGVDIAVVAWILAMRRMTASPCRAQLLLHAFDEPCQYLSTEMCQLLKSPTSCIRVETGAVSRAQIGSWLRGADAVLYPSRWEGLGLSMLEALHAGVPVLATNGTPMWDAVVHGHNGLLIAAERVEDFHLSPHYEVDEKALADAIVLLVTHRSLLKRITAPQPGLLLARQHSFVLRTQELVCQRVMSFGSAHIASLYAGPHPLFRRAELFRSDALRRHGFLVDDIAIPELISSHPDPAAVSGHIAAYDITLLSKPSPELAKLIRCTPTPAAGGPKCINWFWDPLDFTPSVRAWFESIAPLHAAVFINEKGREVMWSSRLGVPVHFIGEGTMTVAPGAAAGFRPPHRDQPRSVGSGSAANATAVFLGTLIPEEADVPRASLLNHLIRETKVRVKLYGPEEGWALAGMTSLGPKYGSDAYEAMAAGDIVLSLSRAQPNVTMYRSERLTGASRPVLNSAIQQASRLWTHRAPQMPPARARAC